MGGMNMFDAFAVETSDLKRKREKSDDIPKPFLRGGEDAVWKGGGTGANMIGIAVKRIKSESP